MYQGRGTVLSVHMRKPIVNRNDNQYSSPMNATQVETTWRHADDTPCTTPDECGKVRDVYFWGGRPDFGTLDE